MPACCARNGSNNGPSTGATRSALRRSSASSIRPGRIAVRSHRREQVMHAIRVSAPGPIEALRYTEIEPGPLRPGEVRVELQAIGVNYIDVYHRIGLYALPTPFTPGSEGAGLVAEIGPGVTNFAVGDRVAYAMVRGAYTEQA